MTDLSQKPLPNVPTGLVHRLGWWHSLWHRALLFGHETTPPPAVETPPAIQDLVSLLEDHRSQFAEAARRLGAEYKGGYWMMYLVAPLAVLSSAAASAFGGHGRVLSGTEFILIVSILVLFLAMRRGGWQERWIRARRTAEHLRYLPVVAPLIDDHRGNWYEALAARHGTRVIVDEEINRVCAWLGHTNAAATLRLGDPAFYRGYLRFVDDLLTQQIHYHSEKASMERALTRRISVTSTTFFGVTIVCTAFLFFETLPIPLALGRLLPAHDLRLLATVLPAIGAGLRGLLAQGESHRVAALSEGMAIRLAQLRTLLRALPADALQRRQDLEDIVWNAVQELLSEADTWMRLQESVPLSVAG